MKKHKYAFVDVLHEYTYCLFKPWIQTKYKLLQFSIIFTKQFCLFFMRWKLWVILSLGCLEKAMTRTVTALLWFNNCLLAIVSCTKHEKKEEVIMYPCHGYIIHCIQDTNFIDLQRKLLHESYSFMKAVDKCIENIGVSMSVYLVLENKIGNKWAF